MRASPAYAKSAGVEALRMETNLSARQVHVHCLAKPSEANIILLVSAGMPAALDLFVLVVAWVHVLLAPYTKVEESFNLHATHDVLMYGVRPSVLPKYDHVTFPGAVPRTFVGSILLAWISTPFIIWWNALGLSSTKFDLQIASMCAAS